MRYTAQRKDGGKVLRAVMAAEGGDGIGLQELARRTRLADPANKGVSYQLLGFLTQPAQADGGSRHARETCSVPTAYLIEDALSKPRGSLFDVIEAPSRSDPQPSWDALKMSAASDILE